MKQNFCTEWSTESRSHALCTAHSNHQPKKCIVGTTGKLAVTSEREREREREREKCCATLIIVKIGKDRKNEQDNEIHTNCQLVIRETLIQKL